MRIIICIKDCEAITIRPFGVREIMGNGEKCKADTIYYANLSNKGDYYVCSEEYAEGEMAHLQTSFMGLFSGENFVNLSEWREQRINCILND
jgi:hypothetical protein